MVTETEIAIASPEGTPERLFVQKKVEDYIHKNGCNVSGEVIGLGALNNEIQRILDRAIERAKANNRKTIMARDI
ncbi:MAG TPA: hypothetical protein VMZ91_12770 [Candidatus Paceibacterota bacterium]|nr:hypothetical protein [Candidatus Paceibacterota bacterium]